MPSSPLRTHAPKLTQSNNRALAAAPTRQDIDPSRTDVFQRGADGKLHPIPGWTTTGPFDIGRWSRNIDWLGVARDLGTIGARSIGGAGLPGLASSRSVAGVAGQGLTAADKLTLGAGSYVAADSAAQSVAPKTKPKHW